MPQSELKTGDAKTVYRFPDADRSVFDAAGVGSEITVPVLDGDGHLCSVSLRVTRNAKLGSWRWIYGKVLDTPEGSYYQIEFKLKQGHPESDTAEMFLQAPPLEF